MKDTNVLVKIINFKIGVNHHNATGRHPEGFHFKEHYTLFQLFAGVKATPNFGIERILAEIYEGPTGFSCIVSLKQDPNHYAFYGKGASLINSDQGVFAALITALEDAGCIFSRLEGILPVDKVNDLLTAVAQVLGCQDNILISHVEAQQQ